MGLHSSRRRDEIPNLHTQCVQVLNLEGSYTLSRSEATNLRRMGFRNFQETTRHFHSQALVLSPIRVLAAQIQIARMLPVDDVTFTCRHWC